MPIAARRVLILDNLVPERLVRTVRSAPPHPKVELVSAKPKNIFNEYLSRELYQCTSQYVETLAQLQSFIKKAFEEYSSCQAEVTNAGHPKIPQENEALNEILAHLGSPDASFPLLELAPQSDK
ncbi:hypothetical protein AAVH_14101 [Aphelenchoides avenae]|nr:hypothetical protein AAVH_14101 [Aphelenchus avenae]